MSVIKKLAIAASVLLAGLSCQKESEAIQMTTTKASSGFAVGYFGIPGEFSDCRSSEGCFYHTSSNGTPFTLFEALSVEHFEELINRFDPEHNVVAIGTTERNLVEQALDGAANIFRTAWNEATGDKSGADLVLLNGSEKDGIVTGTIIRHYATEALCVRALYSGNWINPDKVSDDGSTLPPVNCGLVACKCVENYGDEE